jgi:hypothetical protein
MLAMKPINNNWKVGDSYEMYPFGIDFVVEGKIRNKKHLKEVKMFSPFYRKPINNNSGQGEEYKRLIELGF